MSKEPHNRTRFEIEIDLVHCNKSAESLAQTMANDPSVTSLSPDMTLIYLHEVHQMPEEGPSSA